MIAFQQNQTTKQLAHLHMEPHIKTQFDAPADDNPVFFVMNNGDVALHALSVRHSMFIYDLNAKELVIATKAGMKFSDRIIY